jgi:hypothetical protein
VLFLTILAAEAALPMRVSVPPVWELVVSVLATYAVTGVVDHDRPLASVVQVLRAEASTPRPARRAGVPVVVDAGRLRFRPAHQRISDPGSLR